MRTLAHLLSTMLAALNLGMAIAAAVDDDGGIRWAWLALAVVTVALTHPRVYAALTGQTIEDLEQYVINGNGENFSNGMVRWIDAPAPPRRRWWQFWRWFSRTKPARSISSISVTYALEGLTDIASFINEKPWSGRGAHPMRAFDVRGWRGWRQLPRPGDAHPRCPGMGVAAAAPYLVRAIGAGIFEVQVLYTRRIDPREIEAWGIGR